MPPTAAAPAMPPTKSPADDPLSWASPGLLNCREGANPSVTGFRVSNSGNLTPTRFDTPAQRGMESGCDQVSFNHDGTVLVMSQRTDKLAGQAADDEGTLDTFVVNDDGTLGQQQTFDATGQGPFGFTFNRAGALLTTERSTARPVPVLAPPPATT